MPIVLSLLCSMRQLYLKKKVEIDIILHLLPYEEYTED